MPLRLFDVLTIRSRYAAMNDIQNKNSSNSSSHRITLYTR